MKSLSLVEECKLKQRYNFYLLVSNNHVKWQYLMLAKVWERDTSYIISGSIGRKV
jgi:hypothetical protein